MRCSTGMKLDSMFRKVVLPAPVPPEISMLMRALTAAFSTSSISRRNALQLHQVSAASGPLPNRRIDRPARPAPEAE